MSHFSLSILCAFSVAELLPIFFRHTGSLLLYASLENIARNESFLKTEERERMPRSISVPCRKKEEHCTVYVLKQQGHCYLLFLRENCKE